MAERMCPRHVKRRLPIFADVARFHVFAYRLAMFRCFRCNTGQRTCPRQVKRRLPVFARRHPFPRFRPSLSRFYVFPLENGASYVSPSS
jgi:hypothetical protein